MKYNFEFEDPFKETPCINLQFNTLFNALSIHKQKRIQSIPRNYNSANLNSRCTVTRLR